MDQLKKIKSIKIKNFFSIGNEPIYIDFTQLGNIINLKGENGSGKSSLIQSIIYGIYGKLLKTGLSHKQVINNINKKNLEIEVCFDDYKIIRTRKPDSLRLFCNDEELTLGGMPATQELINNIVGLNYESFVNTCYFGQHNYYTFLSCDAATKRKVIENLLSLEKYNKYLEIAKKEKKLLEEDIALSIKDLENSNISVKECQKRISHIKDKQQNWLLSKTNEISLYEKKIELAESNEEDLQYKNDLEKYNKAQELIEKCKSNLSIFEEQNNNISSVIENKKEQINNKNYALLQSKDNILDLKRQLSEISNQKKRLEVHNNSLKKLTPGIKCNLCYGVIDEKNYNSVESHNNEQILCLNERISILTKDLKELENKYDEEQNLLNQWKEELARLEKKKVEINSSIVKIKNVQFANEKVKKPEITNNEQQIKFLKEALEQKKSELSSDPYEEMLESAKKDLSDWIAKQEQLKETVINKEKDVPYYDFWVKAFGDYGIRSYVISNIIPSLNSRINYWLQFLMDNRIKLTFDNNLEETIESNPPNGDPYYYAALSGGENQRIDLAISQAFAYVTMLSNGAFPSIVVLDEVAANVDRQGIPSVYATICELAKDRQVIVITHDPDLQDLLGEVDTIEVFKKNGFSTINKV